jgi:enoyl-[acyl-carrier-protein] reductase (NADH)
MFNKYSVLALIGSASTATSPLPGSNPNYPKYGTVTATLDTTNDYVSNNLTPKFSATVAAGTISGGPIRGYREAFVVFPTQTISKAGQTTAEAACTLASAASGTRTFYQTTTTELGTHPVAINTSDLTTVADGAVWLVC